jgi:hypothetical protein
MRDSNVIWVICWPPINHRSWILWRKVVFVFLPYWIIHLAADTSRPIFLHVRQQQHFVFGKLKFVLTANMQGICTGSMQIETHTGIDPLAREGRVPYAVQALHCRPADFQQICKGLNKVFTVQLHHTSILYSTTTNSHMHTCTCTCNFTHTKHHQTCVHAFILTCWKAWTSCPRAAE